MIKHPALCVLCKDSTSKLQPQHLWRYSCDCSCFLHLNSKWKAGSSFYFSTLAGLHLLTLQLITFCLFCVCLFACFFFSFSFNFYKYMKNFQRHPKIRDISGVWGLSIWYIVILFKISNILLNYPSFYSWFLWQIQAILLIHGYLWGHTFMLTTLSKIL